MTFVMAHKAEMSFCPGCTHGTVLEQLGEALRRLDLSPTEVCLVSDIGCIGISDRYFSCHTFHGLHGRSIAYAEGIKRTRPELTVVVLIGDGGCGIGTAHLVHAARRNVGVKVLVCNNFNYGMTGGQHSATTPECALTTTTPTGVVDRPFDIGRTVAVNGASYVARCSALELDCVDYIEQALRAPGFALVDLWELCVAYFVPSNKLTRPKLRELSGRLDMPFGVVRMAEGSDAAVGGGADGRRTDSEVRKVDGPRAGGARTAASEPAAQGQSADSRAGEMAPLPWPGRVEVCVAGSAGQRVRSAMGVIGELGSAVGLYAAALDDFPITVRKGHSVSYLIMDRTPIRYTGTDDPKLVVVLTDEGCRRVGPLLGGLGENGLILAEEGVHLPSSAGKAVRFDLKGVSRGTGAPGATLAVLVAGLVVGGWFEPDSLLSIARGTLQGRYAADNLKALEAGCALAATLGRGVRV